MVKLIRILVITGGYLPEVGGIITVIREVCERLVSCGHDCTVLTINNGKGKKHEMIRGVEVIRITSPAARWLLGFSPALLVHLLRRKNLEGYDIIYVHGYHSVQSLESIVICRCLHRMDNIIFSPHYHAQGHTAFRNLLHKFYRPAAKYAFSLASYVICVSLYEADLVRKNFKIDPGKIKIIPHGVEKIGKKKGRREIEGDTIRLLYVGYLREYKGVQYILNAVKYIKDKYGILAEFKIIGTGEDKSKLENIAQQHKIGDRIFWAADLSKDDLEEEYKKADIFILLSQAEAYGIVVAESLAFGTPCIVANTSALKEFTSEPGCFGIDYPIDVAELSDLIVRLHREDVSIGPFTGKIRTWDLVSRDYEETFGRFVKPLER